MKKKFRINNLCCCCCLFPTIDHSRVNVYIILFTENYSPADVVFFFIQIYLYIMKPSVNITKHTHTHRTRTLHCDKMKKLTSGPIHRIHIQCFLFLHSFFSSDIHFQICIISKFFFIINIFILCLSQNDNSFIHSYNKEEEEKKTIIIFLQTSRNVKYYVVHCQNFSI